MSFRVYSNEDLSIYGGTMVGSIFQPVYPTRDNELVNKSYVDFQISQGVPDATTNIKGKILIGGDLVGTADAPMIGIGKIDNSKLAPTTFAASIKGSGSGSTTVTDLTLGPNLVVTNSVLSVNSTNLPFLPLAGGIMSGNVTMGNTFKIIQPQVPVNPTDVTNKIYVDSQIVTKQSKQPSAVNNNLAVFNTSETIDSGYNIDNTSFGSNNLMSAQAILTALRFSFFYLRANNELEIGPGRTENLFKDNNAQQIGPQEWPVEDPHEETKYTLDSSGIIIIENQEKYTKYYKLSFVNGSAQSNGSDSQVKIFFYNEGEGTVIGSEDEIRTYSSGPFPQMYSTVFVRAVIRLRELEGVKLSLRGENISSTPMILDYEARRSNASKLMIDRIC